MSVEFNGNVGISILDGDQDLLYSHHDPHFLEGLKAFLSLYFAPHQDVRKLLDRLILLCIINSSSWYVVINHVHGFLDTLPGLVDRIENLRIRVLDWRLLHLLRLFSYLYMFLVLLIIVLHLDLAQYPSIGEAWYLFRLAKLDRQLLQLPLGSLVSVPRHIIVSTDQSPKNIICALI